MVELVVAKYKEDVSWAHSSGRADRVSIYDKSESGNLPNVGREAHTYVYHIVQRYNTLAEITVFTQGNPFPHSGNFSGLLTSLPDVFGPSVQYLNMTQGELTDDKYGCGHHCGLNIYETWEQLFVEPCPEQFTFNPGAMFAVSSRAVRQYPQEFWSILLSVLDKSVDPVEAWRLERMWKTLFENLYTPRLIPFEPSTAKAYN